jgi:hypothetical protein
VVGHGGYAMRMIAGSILILAAAVLYAAQWSGRVSQNPAVVGSPEASALGWAITILGVAGIAAVVAGLVSERKT